MKYFYCLLISFHLSNSFYLFNFLFWNNFIDLKICKNNKWIPVTYIPQMLAFTAFAFSFSLILFGLSPIVVNSLRTHFNCSCLILCIHSTVLTHWHSVMAPEQTNPGLSKKPASGYYGYSIRQLIDCHVTSIHKKAS